MRRFPAAALAVLWLAGNAGAAPAAPAAPPEQLSPTDPDGTCPSPPPELGQPPVPEPVPRGSKTALKGLPLVGSPAKGFSLPDLRGKPLAFDPSGGGQPTLLVFWSIFCEPCKEEISMYGWAGEKYSPQGLKLLAVNLDGDKMSRAVANFLKMQGLDLTVLLDRKEGKRLVTADMYEVTGTPTLILVGRDGRIVWAHRGRTTLGDLESAIQRALSS